MKFETLYRYIAWDYDGKCWSQEAPPRLASDSLRYWTANGARFGQELEYFGLLSGELAVSRYYDTENEEDMKILQALVEL